MHCAGFVCSSLLCYFLLRVLKRIGESFSDAQFQDYVTNFVLAHGLTLIASMICPLSQVTKCVQDVRRPDGSVTSNCGVAILPPAMSISTMIFMGIVHKVALSPMSMIIITIKISEPSRDSPLSSRLSSSSSCLSSLAVLSFRTDGRWRCVRNRVRIVCLLCPWHSGHPFGRACCYVL